MRHITIYINDNEYNHFLELAKNLSYVKKIETDEEPNKEEIVNNLNDGLKEVKLYKQGKLETINGKDFLNEL